MTVQLGILLALLCALASNVAFLYKHRGACAAPDVDWRHPLRSGKALFCSRWFAVGITDEHVDQLLRWADKVAPRS